MKCPTPKWNAKFGAWGMGFVINVLFMKSLPSTLVLFYKNHFYKNNEAQIAEKLRIS